MAKIPFLLVTGFLGSGKTTLLRELLSQYSQTKRILLIQNEFADSGVDGQELANQGWKFSLLEMNKGSVFCVCLFSDFKHMVIEQIDSVTPDLIVLEATGVADPIAISQLLDDPQINNRLYLSHIWCVVDAINLLKVKGGIRSIPNQIRVADSVVVNKCEAVETTTLEQIDTYIKEINPYAHIAHTSFCKIDFDSVLRPFIKLDPLVSRKNIVGELTKCDQRELMSQTFKTTVPISTKKLDKLISEIPEDIIRLKGFVRVENSRPIMIQYVSGQHSITELTHDLLTTELIAIGLSKVDFSSYF